IPAPISPRALACSKTSASTPRRRSATAAVKPPIPPPMIATRSVRVMRRRVGSLPRRQMRAAAAIELVIGIAHGLGLGGAEHHLEIDRLKAFVLIAMDDTGRAGDAFPGSETARFAASAFIFDEDGEIALQDEEDFLDLVGVRGIALARRHIHDAQSEGARRDDGRIAMLARAAGADEAMLRAAIAFDLRVFEGFPIPDLVAKAPDIALGDLLDRKPFDLGRHFVSCDRHDCLP